MFGEAEAAELKRKQNLVQAQSASDKPIAVIVTARKDSVAAFSKAKGYFKANVTLLREKGYEVIEIEDVANPRDLKEIMQNIPNGKLNFFWLRAHGAPEKMLFSESHVLHAAEVSNVFAWLPAKLNSKAIIYLDSCLTGNIEGNKFYNNIQFSFGKLTTSLQQVKIIAPSEVSYIDRFDIDTQGNFSIHSRPAYQDKDTILILDEAVKTILLQNGDQAITIETATLLRNNLKSSAVSNFTFNQLYSNKYLEQTGLDHFSALLCAIKENNIDAAKELINLFDTNPNQRELPLLCESNEEFYCPLNMAIKVKNLEMLKFLLEKGADIFIKHNQLSPYEYLLKTAYNSSDVFYLEAIHAFEEHVKNDPDLYEKFQYDRQKFILEKDPYFQKDPQFLNAFNARRRKFEPEKNELRQSMKKQIKF